VGSAPPECDLQNEPRRHDPPVARTYARRAPSDTEEVNDHVQRGVRCEPVAAPRTRGRLARRRAYLKLVINTTRTRQHHAENHADPAMDSPRSHLRGPPPFCRRQWLTPPFRRRMRAFECSFRAAARQQTPPLCRLRMLLTSAIISTAAEEITNSVHTCEGPSPQRARRLSSRLAR